MKKEKKYHYTYVLIGEDNRLYIGVHSDDKPPKEDGYMGSFSDRTFKPISKHILGLWPTRKEAVIHEIKLHNEFDVGGSNKLFVNKAKQTSVGFDITGYTHTDETKANLSILGKGRRHSPESRLLMSHKASQRKYKPLTEEHKQKISESSPHRPCSEANKRMLSELKKGVPRSLETVIKMSASTKGRQGKPHTEEEKRKISEANKGRKFSDEHRENLRKSWAKRRELAKLQREA